MTGLPDVTHFAQRLERSPAGAGGSSVAVLVLGVETDLQTTCGPGATSQSVTLRGIAGRITLKLPADGFVARLGDRSFAILLTGGDKLTLVGERPFPLKAAIVASVRRTTCTRHSASPSPVGATRLRHQPVFDPADRGISGVEVLLRWEHRLALSSLPETFLAAARLTGAIVAIGRWVVEQLLRQLSQ